MNKKQVIATSVITTLSSLILFNFLTSSPFLSLWLVLGFLGSKIARKDWERNFDEIIPFYNPFYLLLAIIGPIGLIVSFIIAFDTYKILIKNLLEKLPFQFVSPIKFNESPVQEQVSKPVAKKAAKKVSRKKS